MPLCVERFQAQTTQAEADAARKAAAAASEEGKKRDSLVFANRQLESARHFDRAAQDRELRRLQAEVRQWQCSITLCWTAFTSPVCAFSCFVLHHAHALTCTDRPAPTN